MKTLVIDSATEACSVALFDGAALIGGDCRMLGRGHAEQLVPMIQALPGKGQAERIAVALGPGSFTGVRVGLAAARALAFAWNAELVGYPTLSLLAAMAQREHPGEAVTVCTTGGHGEWFVQAFDASSNPLGALASMRPDDAARGAGTALLPAVRLKRWSRLADKAPGCRSGPMRAASTCCRTVRSPQRSPRSMAAHPMRGFLAQHDRGA